MQQVKEWYQNLKNIKYKKENCWPASLMKSKGKIWTII